MRTRSAWWLVLISATAVGWGAIAPPASGAPPEGAAAPGDSTPVQSPAAPFTARINFQPKTTAVPAGYTRDSGAAWSWLRGSGWLLGDGSASVSLGNHTGARTGLPVDPRLASYVMTTPLVAGVNLAPARWELAVASGTYRVTVAVGDPGMIAGVHRVVVEGTVAIAGFRPSSATPNLTASVTVVVTDGRLTLDTTGGTNTKLDYVDVDEVVSPAAVLDVTPADLTTGVDTTSSVTMALGTAMDLSTFDAAAVFLVAPDGTHVPASLNTDAAAAIITITPTSALSLGATYVVTVTSRLEDMYGRAFTPFSSTFTTAGTPPPPPPFTFTRTTFDHVTGPTSLAYGPDQALYVALASGQIRRYPLDASGVPQTPATTIDTFTGKRLVTGIAFDPRSTPAKPILWVSNNLLTFTSAGNFTGRVSVLTGPGLTHERKVINGLPRSTKDHMVNSLGFGPDGHLYVSVGALTGFGAPDQSWGYRAETPLAGSILTADVINDARLATTLNVDTSKGYDPFAPGAPVTVVANGMRNAFDFVWHSNGRLYAPVNESAGGNAPAGPGGTPPSLIGLPAGNDYLALVTPGGYYGHPNPSIGRYTLNGGNPTAGVDPFEVPQYPVGTLPEAGWVPPVFDFGLHQSPDGVTEYRAGNLGGALQGRLIVTRFSGGDDLQALTLTGGGNAISSAVTVAGGFNNPLDVVADPVHGNLIVAEYGSQVVAQSGQGGALTVLVPLG